MRQERILKHLEHIDQLILHRTRLYLTASNAIEAAFAKRTYQHWYRRRKFWVRRLLKVLREQQ